MTGLTVFAIIAVAYTLAASKLDRWWISAPMVFVAAGTILGPGVLDVLPASLRDKTVLTITELTLAMLLFSDASTVRLRDVGPLEGALQRRYEWPALWSVKERLITSQTVRAGESILPARRSPGPRGHQRDGRVPPATGPCFKCLRLAMRPTASPAIMPRRRTVISTASSRRDAPPSWPLWPPPVMP